MMIASSSNGRTADSDSVNLGSSPGEAAIKTPASAGFFWRCVARREPRFGSESKVGEREGTEARGLRR